jgi:hypothetical protein
VTLSEGPELPSRLLSNSLSPDSVARLVSAATVEVALDAELAFDIAFVALVSAAAAAAAVLFADAALAALRRL